MCTHLHFPPLKIKFFCKCKTFLLQNVKLLKYIRIEHLQYFLLHGWLLDSGWKWRTRHPPSAASAATASAATASSAAAADASSSSTADAAPLLPPLTAPSPLPLLCPLSLQLPRCLLPQCTSRIAIWSCLHRHSLSPLVSYQSWSPNGIFFYAQPGGLLCRPRPFVVVSVPR